MTPCELWFGKKPKLSFLKVWGCDAYVKKFQHDKLKPKSEKCVFIEYPKETIGYTFYHRSEGKIFVAKNGSFLEKEFLSKLSNSGEGTVTSSSYTFLLLTSFERNSFSRKDPFLATKILPSDLR